MANVIFDGTTNVSADNFDIQNDQLVFTIPASDVAVIENGPNGAVIATTSGTTLTFPGLGLAALAALQVLPTDVLQFGTSGNETGANTLTAIESGSAIAGAAGNDSILGGIGADVLFGNQDSDTLRGGGGDDRLYGGQGNDTITFGVVNSGTLADDSDTSVLAVGGLGTDNISGVVAGSATVYGGNGTNDTADGADTIALNLATGSSVEVYGNGGNDSIVLTAGGSANAEVMAFGGQGDDTIAGNAAGTLAANVGDGSMLVGGLGEDVINVAVTGTDASVTVYGGNGTNDTADGADVLSVSVTGAAQTAFIYGNGGDDNIILAGTGSGNGEIHAFGGAGDDTIAGNAGGTTAGFVGDGSEIYGGLGADVINVGVTGSGAAITVFGGNGSNDAADGIDNITVALTGTGATAQTAEIYGNGGNDIINLTGAGEATAFGGAGNDTFNLGDSAGAAGSQTGVYSLTGGAGDDVFNFTNYDFAPASATVANTVHITDFNFGEDTITLTTPVAAVVTITDAAAVATINAAADLGSAAAAALDEGEGVFANTTEIGVIFTYGGEQYLATGAVDTANAATATDVDALIRITGYEGTPDVSAFA